MLTEIPELLDIALLRCTLGEMGRLLGAPSPQAAAVMLADTPTLAYMCGSLRGQSRGDRDPMPQLHIW